MERFGGAGGGWILGMLLLLLLDLHLQVGMRTIHVARVERVNDGTREVVMVREEAVEHPALTWEGVRIGRQVNDSEIVNGLQDVVDDERDDRLGGDFS